MFTYHRMPVEIVLAVPDGIDPKGVGVVVMEALGTLPIIAAVRATGLPVETSPEEITASLQAHIEDGHGITVVSSSDPTVHYEIDPLDADQIRMM